MTTRPEILYEDEHMLVVNKPAGILSVPDRFDPTKANLTEFLRHRYGDIIKVHRLDRETSGVICFARHPEAHRHLSLQFERHQVRKLYVALVDGVPTPEAGTIKRPIAPDPSRPGRMIAAAKGKEAVTSYRVLEHFQRLSLVEAEIRTGRTHQIRVHMQYLGHPLAVDEFYGSRTALYLSEIKGKNYRLGKDQEERPLLRRLSLHAQQLYIRPLGSEELLQFDAPLPKDLAVVIKQLKKWG